MKSTQSTVDTYLSKEQVGHCKEVAGFGDNGQELGSGRERTEKPHLYERVVLSVNLWMERRKRDLVGVIVCQTSRDRTIRPHPPVRTFGLEGEEEKRGEDDMMMCS